MEPDADLTYEVPFVKSSSEASDGWSRGGGRRKEEEEMRVQVLVAQEAEYLEEEQ